MISFSKYSGCGNDFIMIDQAPSFSKDLIQRLCHRQKGIGADGVIFLEKGKDFKMHIFNADGSEAEMCGNGLRCLAAFIVERGFKQQPYQVQIQNRALKIDFTETGIKGEMGDPIDLQLDQAVEIDGQRFACHTLDTGVPHAVILVDSLAIPVNEWGSKIRHHPQFAPRGVNVNFIKRVGAQEIAIRTFERGVEAETLACGTGACASAIVSSLKWGMPAPIQVRTKADDTLEINFINHRGNISQVTQTGPAVKHFHGIFDIKGYL